MRFLVVALLLIGAPAFAAERALRFSVSESWAMPLMRYEQGQAAGGILYDLHTRLAEKVGRRAEQPVLPRQRVQQLLERGEIDVRCYVNPTWLKESHYQYIWSLPFMVQRDLLVARSGETALPRSHSGERIGTVLGFIYPPWSRRSPAAWYNATTPAPRSWSWRSSPPDVIASPSATS